QSALGGGHHARLTGGRQAPDRGGLLLVLTLRIGASRSEQQAAVRGEARAGLALGGEGEPAGGRPSGWVQLPERGAQLRTVLVGLGDHGDHTALGAGGDGGQAW